MPHQQLGSKKTVNLLVVSPTQLLCDALRGILAREKGIRVLEQQESFNNVAAVCRADPELAPI
jgi:hypothetical protein